MTILFAPCTGSANCGSSYCPRCSPRQASLVEMSDLEIERARNADLTARLDRERTLRITAEASLAALALSAKADTTDCGEGNDVTACGVCGTCLRASRDYAVTQRANAEFARVRAEEDARRWEARVKLLDARAARAVDALQGRTDGGDA